ncbi:APC amino acid permease [Amylocystis lapponica]|nr:APC amino acid permease [Amylocystis lapponica]
MPLVSKPIHAEMREIYERHQSAACSAASEWGARREQARAPDADEQLLARLGYKQEFQRAFSPFEVFGLVFSIFGLFPSISSLLVYALPNGGAAAVVWGWAICSIFIVCVTLALAELGSAAPTAGGLYYWTFTYASPKWRRVLSWIVGYSNTIGLISGLAAVDWSCAVQIMAAVSIGSDTNFSPTTAQTFGLFTAILLSHAIITSLATHVLARLQSLYVALNILICLAVIVALPAATPDEFRNSARYAFGDFENLNGWPNGFAFVLSFLAPLWTIGGFDSALHLSEEVSNARIAVPWAIVGATSLAAVLGWAINVVIAFCMGKDIESILASPIGQPMAVILFNSLGQRGTLAIWSVVIVLLASSRQTFAFARDDGLPFSRYLYRVNRYTRTPVNCAWFSASIAFLLVLLSFAGSEAIYAIFGLGVAAQYVAYSLPILCRFMGGTPWGLPVAIIAVVWMVFSTVIVVFPAEPGPTVTNMNYTSVFLGGWILLCLVYYYFPVYGGVYWFRGPVANVEMVGEKLGERDGVDDEKVYIDRVDC